MLKPRKISKNQNAQKHSCILQASGSKHNGVECLTVLLFLILVSRKPALCRKIILKLMRFNTTNLSLAYLSRPPGSVTRKLVFFSPP